MRVWYNHGYSQTRDAFVQLRQANGLSVNLIATSANPVATVFQEADFFAVEPQIDRSTTIGQNAYVDWCLGFAREHRVNVFVVQRGRSVIARRRSEFEAHGITIVVAASGDMLDEIENKARFYEICRVAGLPTPACREVHNLEEFDQAVGELRELGFEVCIKPPHGVFGAGYWKLDDETTLFYQLMNPDDRRIKSNIVRDALLEMAGLRSAADMPRLLVMQNLPGCEWSVDCVCDNGAIIAAVARKKIGTRQILDASPEILALAGRLANVFQLSNLVNIQFKDAGTDGSKPNVLEINPRMSGGCHYAELAGLNLPDIQLRLVTGTLDNVHIPAARTVIATAVSKAIEVASVSGPSPFSDVYRKDGRCAA